MTKNTTLCISLAARPSNVGTRFHNFLYDELGLDFLYKAFTTIDLAAAIGGVRALGIRGCGVSMPFKEDCLRYVDEVDASAATIGAANTIVNVRGRLTAYNTDYRAIVDLVRARRISAASSTAVAGSGGMARAVTAALHDLGFRNVTIVARNADAGQHLAETYGFASSTTLADEEPRLLINATPIGMMYGPDAERLPFEETVVDAAIGVLDVVAMPAHTPLIVRAERRGVPTISGAEVTTRQAVDQFVLYTGVRPADDQLARATEYSRAG